MSFGLSIVTPPAEEPLSLSEAHFQLSANQVVDATDASQQGDILRLIESARRFLEGETGRTCCTTVFDLHLDCWPGFELLLPRNPVQSVESISYVDHAGVQQVVDPSRYSVDTSREPARITPAYGTTWPSARRQANAITVRFTAGYGGQSDVPANVKNALQVLVAWLYTDRQGEGLMELPRSMRYMLSALKYGDEFVEYAGR